MTHDNRHTRRRFLRTAGVGAATSLACLTTHSTPRATAANEASPAESQRSLRLALASYTLRKFDLEQTLKMTNRVALDAICLKSFHLPMDATDDDIHEVVAKVREAGILLYGGGVVPMPNEEQVNRAFEYAKAAGMTKIIGVPAPAMLPLVHDKVQEYDIEVCIHNHGPGDNVYPTPDVAYERIKKFDQRIGLCHDVGHTIRAGKDPIALSQQCADRLLDVHIKDVTAAAKKGHSTPCGRGIIDLPALLQTFIKVGYKGFLAFEYEEQPNDPLAGLAESVGYIRGVLDAI